MPISEFSKTNYYYCTYLQQEPFLFHVHEPLQ